MSAVLRVIAPIDVTEAMLTSSSLAEADYPVYDPARTYSATDKVILTTGHHRIYQSVQGTNLNHDPSTDATATWWADIGPTNRWAMFDTSSSTQSTYAGDISVTLAAGKAFNSLAVVNASGVSLDAVVTRGGPTIYSRTGVQLQGGQSGGWLDYYYRGFTPISELAFLDLPMYGDSQLTVTAHGTSVALGGLVIGNVSLLGDLVQGGSAGILDYSKKDTDAFGNTSFVKRAYSKRLSLTFTLPNTDIARVHSVLANLRATPCVWVGSQTPNYSPLIVFGFFKDFSIAVSYAYYSVATIEIEGLT